MAQSARSDVSRNGAKRIRGDRPGPVQDTESVRESGAGNSQNSGNQLTDPVTTLKEEMQALGINVNTQGLQGGLFRTEKPQTVDLDVIRDWIDDAKVKYTTRLMQPFHMTILENIENDLRVNFDESVITYRKDPKTGKYVSSFVPKHYSADFCKKMFEVYKVDMIPFEGRRVQEQTEGLRARKDTEVKGAQDPKSLSNFLVGEKGRA